jgi:site-specific DNA recombinase
MYKRFQYQRIRMVTLLEGEITELTVGMKGTFSAIYLKDLGRRTHRGLEQRALAGESIGGKSYGYDLQRRWDAKGERTGGLRVINEEQAAIVRRIFEEFARGRSGRAIALQLNREGITAERGREWSASTIRGNRRRRTGILNNELYIGRQIWNKQTFSKDPDTGRERSHLNDESTWVRADVPHLRIIDDELWEAVKARQDLIDMKPTLGEKRRPKRLFSFLLRCGECGGGMSMISATQYGCSTARNRGTCANRLTISERKLETQVLGTLQSRLMRPEVCEVFCTQYTQEMNRKRMDDNASLNANRAELERTERSIEKLVEAIKNGIDPALIRDEINGLQKRKVALQAALEATNETPVYIHPNMAQRFHEGVQRLLADWNDPQHRESSAELLRTLIEKIVLTPNHDRSALAIDLQGDLEGILKLSARSTARKEGPRSVVRWAEANEIQMVRAMAGATTLDPCQGQESQVSMAGAAGFEPANAGTKNRCLTTWRRPSRRRPYSPAREGRKPPASLRGSAKLALRQAAVGEVEIVVPELHRQLPDLEVPGARRGDRRHFRGAAGEEELAEAFELLRPDGALDHLDAAAAGEVHHRPAGDAVQEAVRRRRVQGAVAHEEDVRPRRLGDLAAPIEHQRVVIALRLRLVTRQGADHVEAGGLALGRRRIGRRAPPPRDVEAEAAADRVVAEIGRPGPHRDGEVDFRLLGRDAHLLGAAPGERAHIGILKAARGEHLAAGGVDLLDAPGDLEIEQPRALAEPLAVLGQLEDLAAISALTFEHGRGVMEGVGEDMDLGFAPGDELAVEPDPTVAVVIAVLLDHTPFLSMRR